MLGIVVVVEVPLVLVLPDDWAKARPVDRAIIADAIRSRFIIISCLTKL
ncbi:hypothetical protein NKI04_21945 [Mesorhizobium sp. M0814]